MRRSLWLLVSAMLIACTSVTGTVQSKYYTPEVDTRVYQRVLQHRGQRFVTVPRVVRIRRPAQYYVWVRVPDGTRRLLRVDAETFQRVTPGDRYPLDGS